MSEVPRFRTFAEFSPYCLSEHSNRTSRRLHFVGTSIGAICVVTSLLTLNAWWIATGLVAGYAFAWSGHYFFEQNRPATFTYPLKSFAGDSKLWKDILTGKIAF